MRVRRRLGVILWSLAAFVLLALSVPTATKGDSFFVLHGLRLQVNDQIRQGDEFEAQIGLVFAVLMLLAGLACLMTAAIKVKKHLASWDWIWPAVGLVGGLALGITQGQVFDCSVYFSLEVCRPDLV